MNDLEQNFLASKLLRILREWLHNIIPEETKNCIRSKTGIVVAHYSDEYYDVVLPEDYDTYKSLTGKINDSSLSQKERDDAEEERNNLILHIKDIVGASVHGYLQNDTIVTIGYLDNKLTTAFILCSNGIYKKV